MRFLGSASPHLSGRGRHSTLTRLSRRCNGPPDICSGVAKPHRPRPRSLAVCPRSYSSSQSVSRIVTSQREWERRWNTAGAPSWKRSASLIAWVIASRIFSRSTRFASICTPSRPISSGASPWNRICPAGQSCHAYCTGNRPHSVPPPSGVRIASLVSVCLDKRDAIPMPACSLPWSMVASKPQALLTHCLWLFAGHL